ncbi:hypothetical protein RQP46_010740 [Phenoliferia psychrophenolica]
MSDAGGSLVRPRTRRQALLRPLFVFATLNPGLSYVQGMNSILAVFWRVFADAHSSELEAEAFAFFALGAMLSQLQDLYVSSLDGTVSPSPASSPRLGSEPPHIIPTGLGATLARYTALLNWIDPTVAAALESKHLGPALYVFRWLTTIFTTTFALPDLLRIWDRLIALHPSPLDTPEALSPVLGHLLDLAIALVLVERPILVSPFSTFHKSLAVLQDPQVEGEQVDRMLGVAWEIRGRRLAKSSPGGTGKAGHSRTASGTWKAAAKNWTTGAGAVSLKKRFWAVAAPEEGHGHDEDGGEEKKIKEEQQGEPRVLQGGERVEGKVLPPPPGSIDERDRRLDALPPPPSSSTSSDENETDAVSLDPIDSDDEGPTLASMWGGWKTSLSRLAASDAAAELSKRTTNLSILASQRAAHLSPSYLSTSDAAAELSKRTTNLSVQAQLLRETGPERLQRVKDRLWAAAPAAVQSQNPSPHLAGAAPTGRPSVLSPPDHSSTLLQTLTAPQPDLST